MCYVCKSSPHLQDCPFHKNASLLNCSVCGRSIYKGQKYFDFKSELIHSQCVMDLSSTEILDVLQIEPKTKQ